jgi:hypothetical protein
MAIEKSTSTTNLCCLGATHESNRISWIIIVKGGKTCFKPPIIHHDYAQEIIDAIPLQYHDDIP